jgi:hypothetical protein
MKHIRFDASVTNHPPVGEAAKAIAVGIAQGSVTGLDQVLPSQFAFESQLLTSGRSNHPQPSQFKRVLRLGCGQTGKWRWAKSRSVPELNRHPARHRKLVLGGLFH